MAVPEHAFDDPFVAADADVAIEQLFTAAPGISAAPSPAGVSRAVLVTFDLEDQPVIQYCAAPDGEHFVARTTVPLSSAQIGSQVVIMCEGGDARLPIVMGVLQGRSHAGHGSEPVPGAMQVHADGERQVITAEREIVLRCGHASITLTRAGKVIIKGTYVLSRSSGYNKIKGAAIDIN